MTSHCDGTVFSFNSQKNNLPVKNYCLDVVLSFPGSHKKFENAVNDFHRLKTSFTS